MEPNHYKNIQVSIPRPIYRELHALTGYRVETFQWLLFRYGDQLRLSHKVFIDCFIYIHVYPRVRQSRTIFQRSPRYISRRILPALEIMAQTFDEIHWDERLNPYNHAPHFLLFVNSIVDSFPIYVSQPTNPAFARVLYNPKYGACIWKVLIVISLLGTILYFKAPFPGTIYDGHIWQDTAAERPRLPGEFTLGDGHFISCQDVITQYTHTAQSLFLPWDQEVYSAIHQHYRARVEHINGAFVHHAMFSGRFRGSLQTMINALHVTAHTMNVGLHREIRYAPCGPWDHFPL